MSFCAQEKIGIESLIEAWGLLQEPQRFQLSQGPVYANLSQLPNSKYKKIPYVHKNQDPIIDDDNEDQDPDDPDEVFIAGSKGYVPQPPLKNDPLADADSEDEASYIDDLSGPLIDPNSFPPISSNNEVKPKEDLQAKTANINNDLPRPQESPAFNLWQNITADQSSEENKELSLNAAFEEFSSEDVTLKNDELKNSNTDDKMPSEELKKVKNKSEQQQQAQGPQDEHNSNVLKDGNLSPDEIEYLKNDALQKQVDAALDNEQANKTIEKMTASEQEKTVKPEKISWFKRLFNKKSKV